MVFIRAFFRLSIALFMPFHLSWSMQEEDIRGRNTSIAYNDSFLLDKESEESLVENSLRQKVHYLLNVPIVDPTYQEELQDALELYEFYLEGVEYSYAQSHREANFEFEQANRVLDGLAEKWRFSWPKPKPPYQDDFQSTVHDLYKRNGTREITTSTGYRMLVILEDNSNLGSIYAILKTKPKNNEENRTFSRNLGLNSCFEGGYIKSTGNYVERFIKCYPYRRALLHAPLEMLHLCDSKVKYCLPDEHGAAIAPASTLNGRLSKRSFKDCFWHFVLNEALDNVEKNMMLWIDEDAKANLAHIDFEHTLAPYDAEGWTTKYPLMLRLAYSFEKLTKQDVDTVLSWSCKGNPSFVQKGIEFLQSNIKKWFQEGKNLRAVAYEKIGDKALSALISGAFTYPKVSGPIDMYCYRDLLSGRYISTVMYLRGSFIIWNGTHFPVKVQHVLFQGADSENSEEEKISESEIGPFSGFIMDGDENSHGTKKTKIQFIDPIKGSIFHSFEDRFIESFDSKSRFFSLSIHPVHYLNLTEEAEGDPYKAVIVETSDSYIPLEQDRFNAVCLDSRNNYILSERLYKACLLCLEYDDFLIDSETLQVLDKEKRLLPSSLEIDEARNKYRAHEYPLHNHSFLGKEISEESRQVYEKWASTYLDRIRSMYCERERFIQYSEKTKKDKAVFTRLGGLKYRDLESLKREVQDLYNLYERLYYPEACYNERPFIHVIRQKLKTVLEKIENIGGQKTIEIILGRYEQLLKRSFQEDGIKQHLFCNAYRN